MALIMRRSIRLSWTTTMAGAPDIKRLLNVPGCTE
jgi:hypothetical protein